MSGSLVHAGAVGPAFYENLSELPQIYSGVESYYLSSYDRTGGNDDGFRGTYSQLYVDQAGEHVIFDADGPGCIYNFWFTGTGMELHWGKLKFYFDGQPKTEGLLDVFGQVNGSTTAYRFWPGKIHFKKSILISTEHGNQNDTPANYYSVVYYYYVRDAQ